MDFSSEKFEAGRPTIKLLYHSTYEMMRTSTAKIDVSEKRRGCITRCCKGRNNKDAQKILNIWGD